jgi:phytoene/squalene synthetase
MLPANRLSFLYVSHTVRARLAGLYSLLATVEQCLYRASDKEVSRAKLIWWLEELLAAGNGAGSHPLSHQLTSCGALKAWPESSLKHLFELALHRVNAEGLGTESELLDLCEALGAIHLELEYALYDQAVPKHCTIKQLSVANGQMQLLRECFWAKQANFYWVPLTLCAQLNLQRQQISNDSGSSLSHQWIPAIAQLSLGNLDSEGDAITELNAGSIASARDNQHWLIFSFLQQRQLVRITQYLKGSDMVRNVASMISQVNILDGWASWRFARQLNRGKWQ